MLGIDGRLGGTDGKITPHVVAIPNTLAGETQGAPGELDVVSMGFLVDDEGTALMWRGPILTKALEQFLTDVRWGDLDYLLIDMPPGTGDIQMGLARMLPQAEMLVVTTPALVAQKVACVLPTNMARRSYMKVAGVVENMSEFVAPDGSRHARSAAAEASSSPARSTCRSSGGSRSSPWCPPAAMPGHRSRCRRPTARRVPCSTCSAARVAVPTSSHRSR